MKSRNDIARHRAGLLLGSALLACLLAGGLARRGSAQTQFADIPHGHWAASAVADLQSKGIVTKSDGARFNGNQYLTRYEAAIYLDRIVHYMESAHKPLHVTQLSQSQMPAIAPGPGRKAMVDLVKNRFIDTANVLLAAPSTAPVTPAQMQVATTQVVIRLEDRHLAPPPAYLDEN